MSEAFPASSIPHSPCPLEAIAGRDVIVFDDMVRTGNTVKECCRLLKEAGAERVVFFVTHFYSSPEVRESLNTRRARRDSDYQHAAVDP